MGACLFFFVFVPYFWRSSIYNTHINKSGQDSHTKTFSELHQFRSRLEARSYQLLYNLLLQIILLVSTTTANIMIKDAKHDNMGRFFWTHAVLSDLFQAIASSLGFNIDKNMDNLSANILEEIFLNDWSLAIGEQWICFPPISMFSSTSSKETLRFWGKKNHCSPRDE